MTAKKSARKTTRASSKTKSGAESAASRAKRSERNIKASIRAGADRADAVLEVRRAQRATRAQAIEQLSAPASPTRSGRKRAPGPVAAVTLGAAAAPAIPVRTMNALGSDVNIGVLIAEGDSWFDYPRKDVLNVLEDEYLYDVESVAHHGDCVEAMAYSDGQFDEFSRRLEKLLRARKVPKAILISGGGNDIAGDEFAILLNHLSSSLPVLNEDIVRGVIDVRLRNAYTSMIAGLTHLANEYLQRSIPIVLHGYANPVPDGRKVGGWVPFLPGPWLKPGFEKKGHVNEDQNKAVMVELINRFNVMLEAVCATAGFEHVHYIDLRKVLRNDAKYEDDWANELHPTQDGFERVAAAFHKVIVAL